jgi:DNA-binding NarL/FixJ family response regulator
MALSTEDVAARVSAVGKDPIVNRTLSKLLELDGAMLETLREYTVGDVLDALRGASVEQTPQQDRHLRVVSMPEERDALASLSERELQVVRLVAEGLSNKEISTRLTLSDKTVKNHISHILAKMGLTARTQVAVYAIRAGFV